MGNSDFFHSLLDIFIFHKLANYFFSCVFAPFVYHCHKFTTIFILTYYLDDFSINFYNVRIDFNNMQNTGKAASKIVNGNFGSMIVNALGKLFNVLIVRYLFPVH